METGEEGRNRGEKGREKGRGLKCKRMIKGPQKQSEIKGKGVRQKVGVMESTILIGFQKHALIHFFACDRLDPESPGETHTGNSSCRKLEEKKITTKAWPCFPCIYILFSNIFFSSLTKQRQKKGAHSFFLFFFHVMLHLRELFSCFFSVAICD